VGQRPHPRSVSSHLLTGPVDLDRGEPGSSTQSCALHPRPDLVAHDPGRLEVFSEDLEAFRKALLDENRTLKRVRSDPRQFSGIGNAHSDETLHAARLSPIAMIHTLTPEQIERLYHATRSTLADWIERLRAEAA
jgi:formamidopyrimidine-DNA glycosylase